MSIFIAPILYVTVGLALFVGWGFARLWAQRGHPWRALAMRLTVVALACYPLVSSLWRTHRDLGMGGLLFVGGIALGLILFFVLLTTLVTSPPREGAREPPGAGYQSASLPPGRATP